METGLSRETIQYLNSATVTSDSKNRVTPVQSCMKMETNKTMSPQSCEAEVPNLTAIRQRLVEIFQSRPSDDLQARTVKKSKDKDKTYYRDLTFPVE